MAAELKSDEGGKVVMLRVTGKLSKADYDEFMPEVDRFVSMHGKINMALEMHDFHGWKALAAWEDAKFGFRHFRHFRRLAVIGETRWQRFIAKFAKLFTTAKVRFFDPAHSYEAYIWLHDAKAA